MECRGMKYENPSDSPGLKLDKVIVHKVCTYLENLFLQVALLAITVANDVPDDIFGRLRFARPALAADNTALSGACSSHRAISFVGHSENVGRKGLPVFQVGIGK